MAKREFFMVDGVQYMRNGAYFYDEYGMELVTEGEKERIKKAYLDGISLDELKQEDLMHFIKYTRGMEEFDKSQEAWVFACQKYAYDENFINKLFPMYLSRIRAEVKTLKRTSYCNPNKIERGEEDLRMAIGDVEEMLAVDPNLQSVAIYISLAAACLDLYQIEKGRRYTKKAQEMNGQKENYHLNLLLERLRKFEEGIACF